MESGTNPVVDGSSASVRLPRTPTIAVALLGWLTLGLYFVYWLDSRSRVLDAIAARECKRIPAWLVQVHYVLAVPAAIFGAGVLLLLTGLTSAEWLRAVPENASQTIIAAEGIFYVLVSFQFRDVLLDIHGTGRRARMNPAPTPSIVLGPIYYQWMINRHDYESAAAQRRARSSAPFPG